MFSLSDGIFETSDTLRFVEEKGRVGLWSYDLGARKLDCSRGLLALAGIDALRAQPTADAIVACVHPDDRGTLADVGRSIEDGFAINCEFRLLRPHGGIRWLAARGEVLFDHGGKPHRAVGVALDVTHRHEAQQALEASKDRQRALLAAISEIVWSARADGSALDCPDWRRLTGQAPEQVCGLGWIEALHPDDRERTRAAWQRAVESRAPFVAEFRVCMAADGAYRWYRSRGAAVLNRDGSLREWVGVLFDIHDSTTAGFLYPVQGTAQGSGLTGAQLRAARGLLNWSVRDLCEASKVSAATIRRLEEVNGRPTNAEDALPALRAALERSGVEFLFPSIGKPAVRLR